MVKSNKKTLKDKKVFKTGTLLLDEEIGIAAPRVENGGRTIQNAVLKDQMQV
jgi:hypothetical protein